ncbi:hypothetical protein TBK1r_78510 [Stieleria magnilauensis]|uniref:Uncharacterized protein n=1 Tax=Stieleria magnilauensis TaxID=2527963 RepID=A0ABX5Y727_9BACT|nr:hypothetical protein TBK1r_78510 [Planctomycetes bacterium TBK1r]
MAFTVSVEESLSTNNTNHTNAFFAERLDVLVGQWNESAQSRSVNYRANQSKSQAAFPPTPAFLNSELEHRLVRWSGRSPFSFEQGKERVTARHSRDVRSLLVTPS